MIRFRIGNNEETQEDETVWFVDGKSDGVEIYQVMIIGPDHDLVTVRFVSNDLNHLARVAPESLFRDEGSAKVCRMAVLRNKLIDKEQEVEEIKQQIALLEGL